VALRGGTSTALAVAVPPYDLRERTRLFALAIVKFCRVYPRPTRPAKPQDN